MRSSIRCGVVLALVLASGCRKPEPPTRIDPDAVPILDGWASALGGRERLAELRSLHRVGRWTSDGNAGTFETWTTARGERRSESELAGIRTVTVFDGVRGWDSDASGLVVELDADALENERSDAYFSTFSALLPDRRGGEVTRVDDRTIKIAVDGVATPITISFDPSTHLPVRETTIEHDREVTTELGDWREVDGIQIPHRIVRRGDAVITREVTRVDRQLGSFAPLVDRTDDVHFTAGSPVSVPLEIDAKSTITIRASVNGSAPFPFVLDTGAPTLLDRGRLHGVTLATAGGGTLHGINGSASLAFAPGVTIELPGLAIGQHTVRTTELAASWPSLRPPIAGLLGAELFQRVVVEIDYRAHQARLYDVATYRHPDGVPLPFVLVERSPAVEATLELPGGERLTGRFLVDTGCECEVIVARPFGARHRLADVLDGSGELGKLAARTAPVTLGASRIDRAQVLVARSPNALLDSHSLAGFIGGKLLRRYRVTIDYRRKQLWLD